MVRSTAGREAPRLSAASSRVRSKRFRRALIVMVAIATLTISARLKRFDITLEEAAYNLGATRTAVLRTITLPYLRPAMIGAAVISFLMSFENFNTTLMLVGSDAPLTVLMYGRMREGASPVLNAVSLFLMLASAVLALLLTRGGERRD